MLREPSAASTRYPSEASFFRRASSASLGLSNAYDPVFTSPARSYVAMKTPVGETADFVSFRASGAMPGPNTRLPRPSSTG